MRAGTGRLGALGLLVSVAALSGCMGSPTYGTGVSANEQLASDVSNILALGPSNRERIDYKPRPELVKPAGKVDAASLPAPQQAASDPSSNPQWPESPEQRRARLRAEATANQDDPMYRPEVAMDGVAQSNKFGRDQLVSPREQEGPPRWEPGSQRAALQARLKEQRQGDPTQRRYLSEPPLDYRQPAATAPVDQLGEDEREKEARRKAEAKKAGGGGSGWFDWLPGV